MIESSQSSRDNRQRLRVRWWALAGFVLALLLIASIVAFGVYKQTHSPDKTIVLVADFDGPEPQNYRVTETILNRLQAELSADSDVQVETLGKVIGEAEGSVVAQTEGEQHQASIVIWGHYEVVSDVVSMTVHFEMLKLPEYMPEFELKTVGLVRGMAVARPDSLFLQTSLSSQNYYLTSVSVGIARYAAANWEGSAAAFSDALSRATEHVIGVDQGTIHFFLGEIYSAQGNYNKAIAEYSSAIQFQDDTVSDIYNNRGVVYVFKGDYDRAISDFDQAIQFQPNHSKAYRNRGDVYVFIGDIEQAIVNYDHAIRLQPDYALAYNSRGLAYAFQSNYNQAIADFTRAIRLQPDLAAAYANRGLAHGKMGNHDQALADFDQAIGLQPDNAHMYVLRGQTYGFMGNYRRAVSDFDHAIRIHSDFADAYYNRGYAYYYLFDLTAARADWEKAIELYEAQGLFDEAEEVRNRLSKLVD